MGLKERKVREIIENTNRGQRKIMLLPVMKEEDLIKIVNKQKNNKAAGVDGVKAEVMKHMVRNRKIRKALLLGFNKSLREPVHRRWMESYTSMLPKRKDQGTKTIGP